MKEVHVMDFGLVKHLFVLHQDAGESIETRTLWCRNRKLPERVGDEVVRNAYTKQRTTLKQ
jgi:hypothetical protein